MQSVDLGNYILFENGAVYSKISKKYLKQSLTREGYFVYGSKLGSVHRLLAEYFLGGIPKGMTVNHIDGNKQNNTLSNLEIISYSNNTKHAFKLGLIPKPKGELNAQAKLTEQECLQLCLDLKNGLDNETVATKYGLHSRYVSLIRGGRRWKHLTKGMLPFPVSKKHDLMQNKYDEFLKLQYSYKNYEIAEMLGVDRSTVSRWRSGQSRNK